MDRLKTNTAKKKKIIIGVVIAALAAITWYVVPNNGSVLGWHLRTVKTDTASSINYQAPTSDQIKNGDDIKKQSLDNQNKPGASGSDQPSNPTPNDNGKSTVEVDITAANQNGSTFQIRSLISALDNGGTCTLSLTRSGYSTVTKTASVQNLSNSSTCAGFDIPVSELTSGDWNAILSYSSSTLQGSSSQTITVR